MRKLTIGEKATEISEHDYLGLVSNLAKGYYILAEAYHHMHASGFADWKGTFQMPDVGQEAVNKAIVDQIDDNELSEAFGSLRNHLQKMEEVDRQIVEWLVRFVGLSSLRDKKDRARLDRRLTKIIVNGPDGHPQGPVWAMQPEYQGYMERSKSIMSALIEAEQHVDRRIRQLLESSSGDGK